MKTIPSPANQLVQEKAQNTQSNSGFRMRFQCLNVGYFRVTTQCAQDSFTTKYNHRKVNALKNNRTKIIQKINKYFDFAS